MEGETLVVSTVYKPGTERQSSMTESWTLSADGKRLTDEFVAVRPDGKETHVRRVFDKQ